MQVPPWHMRRHGPVFVPDRKVLTPQFVLQAGCCWSSTKQHNPWEGGLECGHSWQGVFGQHTVLVACAPVPASRGPSSPGPCEWQWAAQVTVEGSSGRCGHHAAQAASHRAAGTGGTGSIQPGQVLVRGWTRGRTRDCTRARVALEESRPSSV